MKKNKLLLTAIITVLLCSSCNDLVPFGNEETGNVSGTIFINCNAVPQEYDNILRTAATIQNEKARTALPTKPDLTSPTLIKTITAVNQNNKSDIIAADFDEESGAFTVSNLRLGVPYKITASIKDSSTEIFYGESEAFTLSSTNSVIPDIRVELYPITSGDGTGNVKLDIYIDNENIKNIRASVLTNDDLWTKNSAEKVYNVPVTSTGPITVIDVNGISSGSYDINFEFLPKNTDSTPIYVTRQTINVFDGLTTNRWSGSQECYKTIDNTVFLYVDSDLCKKYGTIVDFYVGGKNASDSNIGTSFAPLATIGRAFQKMNDKNANYTINIQSDISLTTTIAFTEIAANTVTIRGVKENTKLSSSGIGSSLIFDTPKDIEITIEKLTITGGNNYSGGGVKIIKNSNIKFGNGTVIKQNKAVTNGAGVYICGNSSTEYPTLKITSGAQITDNHNASAAGVAGLDGSGLGIFVGDYAKVIMTGGEISANTSSKVSEKMGHIQGAGVYIYNHASFEMSGGKIFDNEVAFDEASGASGGAVYVGTNGTFKLSGNAYIPYGSGAGKNDIQLSGTKGNTTKITIDGELTTPQGCTDEIQAVITPPVYSAKNFVLAGETDKLTAAAEKIAIANQGNGDDAIEWIISKSGNGKMQLKNPLMKMYVKSDGSDSNTGKTLDKAFKTLNKCWEVITDQEIADGEYEIYISGTLTGSQTIPLTTTGTDALNIKKGETAKSILISGASDLKNGAPQDIVNSYKDNSTYLRTFNVATDVPVTFKKLHIQGGRATGSDAYYGGGIKIESGADVTLDEYTLVHGNYARCGAGIFNEGKLTVKTNSKIYSNTQDTTGGSLTLGGGGIYNNGANAKVYIEGGEIYSNSAANNNASGGAIYNGGGSVFIYGSANLGAQDCTNSANLGGGIYNAGYLYLGYKSANSDTGKTPVDSTSVTWSGKIQYNMAVRGAGIFNAAGSYVYMKDGTISRNINESVTTPVYNHGLGIWNAGTFIMNGGKIEYHVNKARYSAGAGVFNAKSGTFEMAGGSISNNYIDLRSGAVQGYGGAVYNKGTFKMRGSANIPYGATINGTLTKEAGCNDVYLADKENSTGDDETTSVAAKITVGNVSSSSAATITPQNYGRGKIVLEALTSGTGSITDLTDYTEKFAVAQPESDSEWRNEVYTDKTMAYLNAPIYVKGSGGASTNDGTSLSKAVTSLANAESIITTTNVPTLKYEIIVSGELQCQSLTNSINNKAAGITLRGNTGSSTDIIKGIQAADEEAIALQIKTSVPVMIKNLQITGAKNKAGSRLTDTSETVWGGGIHIVSGADVTLSDGVLVNGNQAKHGAGIYNAGTLTITGSGSEDSKRCRIRANGGDIPTTGNKWGCGVYNDGTLNIEGYAKFEQNGASMIAADTGGAIHNAGTLNMKGNFEFPAGTSNDTRNDIYLEDGHPITITGAINGTAPVAKLSVPDTAADGFVLLQKDAGVSNSDFTAAVAKFGMTGAKTIEINSENNKGLLVNGILGAYGSLANVISQIKADGDTIIYASGVNLQSLGGNDKDAINNCAYKIHLDLTKVSSIYTSTNFDGLSQIQTISINAKDCNHGSMIKNCANLKDLYIYGSFDSENQPYGFGTTNFITNCPSLENIYFVDTTSVFIDNGVLNRNSGDSTYTGSSKVTLHIPSTVSKLQFANSSKTTFGNVDIIFAGTQAQLTSMNTSRVRPNTSSATWASDMEVKVYYDNSTSSYKTWKPTGNSATGLVDSAGTWN